MVIKHTSRKARTRYVHASAAQHWTYVAPRRGATPYLAHGPSGDDRPERGAPKPTREHAETVLLAEDDDAVRKIVARMLENAGFVVLTASNAAEAERVARGHGRAIDLLLADVVMPHGSGRELMERLQSQFPAMRVLYMSGYADEVIAQHGVLSPGMALISKPFNRADLTRRIREILDA